MQDSRYRPAANLLAARHVMDDRHLFKGMAIAVLAFLGALSPIATALEKRVDANRSDINKQKHAQQAMKPAASNTPLPPITNESELTALISSSRARLKQSSQDSRARDALGWAGITLADWALEAEATGNSERFQDALERIRVDLPDVGWRMQNLAERGWPGGWRAVGLLRERGVLLEKDERRACEAYTRAAANSPASQWHTAQCRLRDGDVGPAWSMIEESARAGHAGAQEWMARRCLGDFGGTVKDPLCAREWLIQAVSNGRPSAQTLLAYLMITGSGGGVDIPRGMNLYRQAAQKGDVVAQNNLGESFEAGRVVEKNLTEALNWYERAARSGLPAAQFNAGRLLAVGVDGRRDLVLARKWLLNAKEQGIAEADSVIRWIDEQQPATVEVAPQSASGSGLSGSVPKPGLR